MINVHYMYKTMKNKEKNFKSTYEKLKNKKSER